MNNRQTDRRVQRTRRALRDALISLMTERGWDEVSVQDICDRADIGRSTFYVHFQNKEELLDGGLSDLRHELRSQIVTNDKEPFPVLPFVRGLIDHVYEQRKLFRSIIGRRSGHVVRMRFRELILQLVKEDLSRLAAPGWRRDATVHCMAGALFELLVWVAEARLAVRAEEVDRHFRQLIRPTSIGLGETR